MTGLLTGVTTVLLGLTTFLLAVLMRIFTLARFVTGVTAGVRTTSQRLSTDESAEAITAPTGLILERLLTAQTFLLGQERTLWAVLIIHVAVVSHRRVAAGCWATTGESTGRWTGTTW